MIGTRAAQRYAKAILDLAIDRNVSKEVNGDMKSIAKTITGSEELQDVLASPALKNEQKKNVLLEIFKGSNGLTFGAFDILLDNNRIFLLQNVAQKYTELYNEINNIQIAVVTTAVPLDPALESKILKKVIELTGNTATLKNEVDPSIIGGFILRIGDIQYNASVARNLNDLKRSFSNNTYISKI